MNKFKVVCASPINGSLGVRLWGVANDGRLVTTSQLNNTSHWGDWDDKEWKGAPENIVDLAAVPNRSGSEMSLWARTADNILHCRSQSTIGVWGEWLPKESVSPGKGWLGAPPLTCMCVGLMANGRAFWGFGEDKQLWVTYEDANQKWVDWYTKGWTASEGTPQNMRALFHL
jgi:hypothetical protein